MNEIKRNQTWFCESWPFHGDPTDPPTVTRVRVMAIVDGYVVARVKGCIPFLLQEKDFLKKYKMDDGNDSK